METEGKKIVLRLECCVSYKFCADDCEGTTLFTDLCSKAICLRRSKGDQNRSKGDQNEEDDASQIPLMALNHVSRLCKKVQDSMDFYTKVLGFILINRPPSLNSFGGAWLFNYGVGIHLVQKKDGQIPDACPDYLDPMDNHISFQCEDMEAMEQKLKKLNIKYMKRTINEEEGAPIDHLFFKDPDGFMI